MHSNTESIKGTKHSIYENVRFLATVLAIVILVRLFIAQPFLVNGTSMVPNFHNNDYLIVDELSYKFTEPKRLDVVVVRKPDESRKFLLKRIIALPGETIVFKSNTVTIKNTENPAGIVLDESYISLPVFETEHSVTLTDEQYWVMGDNRPYSQDSRSWGTLPSKNITGRVFLRLWPLSDIAVFPGKVKTAEQTPETP